MKRFENECRGLSRAVPALLLGCTLSILPLAGTSAEKLVVAIKEVPPFVIRNNDGSLSGLAIDLWIEIARELDLEFETIETDVPGMLTGLQDDSFQVAVAALTVTAERESIIDFSHPFHTSGLGIAVPANAGAVSIGSQVFSLGFLRPFASLVLILLFVGFLIWRLERRANPEQFGGKPLQGIGSGFWWSAVTMTTVGYGDKAPVTPTGRLLAVFWMFFSIIAISGFTAAIATVFTVQQLTPQINGPDDLPGRRVGTVQSSTSADYLDTKFIKAREFTDIQQALNALADGSLDAVVYDAPVLRFESSQWEPGEISVLPGVFERQDYAIAMSQESPLREAVNRALLDRIYGSEWQNITRRYLGH
jgi:ABC-type amino acid transport substrate-binding protein